MLVYEVIKNLYINEEKTFLYSSKSNKVLQATNGVYTIIVNGRRKCVKAKNLCEMSYDKNNFIFIDERIYFPDLTRFYKTKYPHYLIDTKGNLYSLRQKKCITVHISNSGYYYYSLKIKGKQKNIFVHRLLAETFIANPLNLTDVDHIDGNRKNNNLENLRWIEHRDNCLRRPRHKHCDSVYELKGGYIIIYPNASYTDLTHVCILNHCKGVYKKQKYVFAKDFTDDMYYRFMEEDL